MNSHTHCTLETRGKVIFEGVGEFFRRFDWSKVSSEEHGLAIHVNYVCGKLLKTVVQGYNYITINEVYNCEQLHL